MTLKPIQAIRRASGLIEYICDCGVGHPHPDSVKNFKKYFPNRVPTIHGCCGCCSSEDFFKERMEIK